MSSNLRDQLQRIYEERGQLTPKLVVEEASNPKHPLHDRFEWDDTVAGRRWRLHQAKDLITTVRVTYTDRQGHPQDVRQFHAVRQPAGHTYEPVERLVEDDVTVKILLADMEREWRTMKARYDRFSEFYEMIRDEVAASVARSR